ncbi:MAG: hypothetical protein AB1847_15500 [bacterium]
MRRMLSFRLFFLCLLCAPSLVFFGQGKASCQEPFAGQAEENSRFSLPLTIKGHFKSLNRVQKMPLEEDYHGFTGTQARLDIELTLPWPLEPGSLNLAYSQVADLLVGENAQALSGKSPFDLPDLDAAPIDEEDTVVKLHPDRLNVNWESEKFSATIGRQAIGFGTLLGFSPLDIIAPFSPLALDKEIRPGVDAIKMEYYPHPFSTVTFVAVIPAKARNRSYLLLYTLAGEKGDFNVLLGENRNKPALGFGYAGALKGMGVRAESLFFGDEHDGNNSGYALAGLEVSYLFQNNIQVDLEFFFHGDGAGDAENYNLANNDADYQTPFAGRYYTILDMSYDLTPLLKFSPAAIANLGDGSMLVSPRLVYSVSDNSEVLAFIDLSLGQSPDRDGTIRSEYGSSPRGGGLFLRLFF